MSRTLELELSWPLPGELGRRWTRRTRRQALLVTVVLAVALAGLAGHAQGGDAVARWSATAVCTAGALVVAPLLAVLGVAWSEHLARGWARDVALAARAGLEPGEGVRGVVTVMLLRQDYSRVQWVLGERTSFLYRGRRPRGVGPARSRRPLPATYAPLCSWSEVQRVELVRRRVTRFRLVGELLRLAGTDRGLRVRARDGRAWFLVAETEPLEALAGWLRERGLEVLEVDDADLAGSVALTPVDFQPLSA